MSTQGWIFMVGFRVFDVGLLVAWMIWFFRLRSDEPEPPEEGGDGGGGSPKPARPRSGPGGGGLKLPMGKWPIAEGRIRDGHGSRRSGGSRRPAPSMPSPHPARVRSPVAPERITRRAQRPA